MKPWQFRFIEENRQTTHCCSKLDFSISLMMIERERERERERGFRNETSGKVMERKERRERGAWGLYSPLVSCDLPNHRLKELRFF
jgi:hypothetical protein